MSIEIQIALISLAGIILTVAGGMFGAWWAVKVQLARVPVQNKKDEMEGANSAFELADKATKRVVDLELRLENMDRILNKSRYRATIEFSLGEVPRIERASIELMPLASEVSVSAKA